MTDEPVTVHVWMPDGRSLCDRRAPARYPAKSTLAERDAIDERDRQAPMCGSCMLLVSRIRRIASALAKEHPTVWPAKPSEAWANLRGTRWAVELDLDEHDTRAEHVDKYSRFHAFMLEVDPASVDELLEEWRAVREKREAARAARRALEDSP